MAKNSRFLQILATHAAAGMSIRDAAKAAKCSERQAYTMAASSEFKIVVASIRDAALTQAVGTLSDAAVKAAKTLVELLGPDNEARDRLTAARLILSNLGPIAEHGELRARIAAIESQGPGLRVAR